MTWRSLAKVACSNLNVSAVCKKQGARVSVDWRREKKNLYVVRRLREKRRRDQHALDTQYNRHQIFLLPLLLEKNSNTYTRLVRSIFSSLSLQREGRSFDFFRTLCAHDETPASHFIILSFFLSFFTRQCNPGWDVRHFEHDVIYWDIVVITTLDLVQKNAYDALIQQRSSINRIPLGVDYLVITDPGKIGE